MATHAEDKDRFGGIVENLFKVTALGLAIVWIITYLLRQLDVIKVDVKVGGGITLLAIALGLMAAYLFIVKKEFAFNWKTDLLPLALATAAVVGAVYFLPKLLPDLYSVGAIQLQGAVQSIFGGLT